MDDNMEDADQPVDQWLHSEHSSTPGDIFGEPVTRTKIGEEYQAQIPPLMTERERLQLIVMPSSHDDTIDVQHQLMFGLPIPVGWTKDQPESNEETKPGLANAHGSANGESSVLGSGSIPVPGSSIETFTPDEHRSFLLALYIFGKSFDVINKFMGNKGMHNVLSYYYGKFYKTEEHQKWSKYKKMKGNRNTIPGKNIFTDWRKEELFSRLFSHVTDECRTNLTHASKMFEEGRLSFEAYVFTVRDTVGIGLLIEAIGIGKGKQDLTGRAKKPVKKKIPHLEYQSLTTEGIVNIMNDHDINGLNKSKLSELFQEAVWPRLLAKGWHSEQATSYTFQRCNKSLVFLAPGITKFSRRGLHKGIQYFESFKDVLNKVASEPELLEPEPEPELIQDKLVPIKQKHMQFRIVDIGFVRVENGLIRKSEIRSMSDTESDTEPTADMQESFSSGALGKTIQDSNSPATAAIATPDSDDGEPPALLSMESLFVCHETITNQLELMDVGGNADDEAVLNNGQRNCLLTSAKSLEALPSSDHAMDALKKKKRDVEEDKAPRHVRAKTSLATSSDFGHIENHVDGDP